MEVINKSKKFRVIACVVAAIMICCVFSSQAEGARQGVRLTGNEKSSRTLRSMARVYIAYGDLNKAEAFAEKALLIAKSINNGDNAIEISTCMIDLAYVYKQQGKLDKAQQICTKGLELQKEAYYPQHPYVGYTLRTLAGIHIAKNEFYAAKEIMEEAVSLMNLNHSPDEKCMAGFYVEQAKIEVGIGNYDKADTFFERSMKLLMSSYGPKHLYTAQVKSEIAELRLVQNRLMEAQVLIDDALLIQEQIYGPDHKLMAENRVKKSLISRAMGDIAQQRTFASNGKI